MRFAGVKRVQQFVILMTAVACASVPSGNPVRAKRTPSSEPVPSRRICSRRLEVSPESAEANKNLTVLGFSTSAQPYFLAASVPAEGGDTVLRALSMTPKGDRVREYPARGSIADRQLHLETVEYPTSTSRIEIDARLSPLGHDGNANAMELDLPSSPGSVRAQSSARLVLFAESGIGPMKRLALLYACTLEAFAGTN